MKTAVFTIASRNYFGVVRTLMNSLEDTNPEYERYVVCADKIDSEFNELSKNFKLLSIDEIDIPNRKKMLFRYTILELNTAIKPFVFMTLIKKCAYDRIIYMDPDICVYDKLTQIETAFYNGYEIILTPHFTNTWKDDGKSPDEVSIMQSGAYNLGFLAVSNSNNSMKMLRWWGDKLERHCVVAFERGIFVDQKWMDLVPGMFDRVFICRDEGYNVAYWNMSHRKAKKRDGRFYFNDQLLVFFHFSGLNPNNYNNISKYQNRFMLGDIGCAKELFDEYAERVLKNNYDWYRKYQYAYNYFSDGTLISELFRSVYIENEWIEERCGEDPFVSKDVFYKNKKQILPLMMDKVWSKRLDVQMMYPNKSSKGYYNWFMENCIKDYGLPKEYIMNLEKKELKKVINQIQKNTVKHQFAYKSGGLLKKVMPLSMYNWCKKIYKTLGVKKK